MARFTSRDGQSLSYIDIGKGPVCVLVHGIGMQASYWLPLVLPLAHRYRFVMPDLRGFGGCTDARHVNDNVFIQFADDLHDLMEHLQLSDVALAGFSMGGMTSVMYQQRYGTDRLRAYLQIDQSPVVQNTDDWHWGLYGYQQDQQFSRFRDIFGQLERSDQPDKWHSHDKALRHEILSLMAEFVEGTLAHPLSRQAVRSAHRLGLSRSLITRHNWPAYLRCMRYYMEHQTDLRDVFNNYDIPLWVFAGTESELYHILGQHQLAAMVPGSNMIEFHGNGHSLPYENPLKFIRHLGEFAGIDANQVEYTEVAG